MAKQMAHSNNMAVLKALAWEVIAWVGVLS
jgi:hypothetical protein